MILTYDEVDAAVSKSSRRNREVYWDGWDICTFRPNRNAYTNPNGIFRKGRWGFAARIPVSSDGTWSVPNDFIK